MKVLVVAPYAINTPHFETELEIVQKSIDCGKEVTILGCDAHLACCDVNFAHQLVGCINCVSRRVEGVKLLSRRVAIEPLYFLKEEDRQKLKEADTFTFSSLEDLKSFYVENFDVGYGVLSSIISGFRDNNPSLERYSSCIKKLINASLSVYFSVSNYLDKIQYDEVYAYNGRYAPLRAVLRACENKGVTCLLHEKGRTLQHFSITENALPHNLEYQQKSILKSWETSSLDNLEKEKIASRFYTDRVQGVSHTWYSFTKNQQKELLPEGWNVSELNVAVFISSEDEFAAIGEEWKNPIYDSQVDGIQMIAADLQARSSNVHLYVRVHPNLKGVDNNQTRSLSCLRGKNLTVIPADNPVSSYALMFKASKVLTFGSTIGIEAAYWGIPSILAGKSLYRNLGSTYNPGSHEELLDMLLSALPPLDRKGALMYGYHQETYGIKFDYYVATGIYTGYFKGVTIAPKPDFNLLVNLAVTQINLDRYAFALQLIEKAILLKPEAIELNYGKAVALAKMGRDREAIDILQKLLSYKPNHQEAKQLVVEVVQRMGGQMPAIATPSISQQPLKHLNLGCGYHCHPAWVNVDFTVTRPGVIAHNLRQGIPFPDRSFDVVYHSHVLEHFPKDEAEPFLLECHRILKTNGIIRVVVPDLEQIARLYLEALDRVRQGSIEWVANYDWILLEMYDQAVRNYSGGHMAAYLAQKNLPNETFILKRSGVQGRQMIQSLRQLGHSKPVAALTPEQVGKFRMSGEVHQWMYDSFSLGALLQKVGFQDIVCCRATESRIPNFAQYHLDTMPNGEVRVGGSLFVEAVKQ